MFNICSNNFLVFFIITPYKEVFFLFLFLSKIIRFSIIQKYIWLKAYSVYLPKSTSSVKVYELCQKVVKWTEQLPVKKKLTTFKVHFRKFQCGPLWYLQTDRCINVSFIANIWLHILIKFMDIYIMCFGYFQCFFFLCWIIVAKNGMTSTGAQHSVYCYVVSHCNV